MGFVGLAFVCIGCLVTGVGLFSFADIFGLMTKDERHQTNTTDNRVQRTGIRILVVGFAFLTIGFGLMFMAGA